MIGISKEKQLRKFKEPKSGKVSKEELRNRVEFILNKGVCQVCNKSTELDYPHHSEFGISKKNDKSLICICIGCHKRIHCKGFPIHGLSREDTVAIGINNNNEFELLYKV